MFNSQDNGSGVFLPNISGGRVKWTLAGHGTHSASTRELAGADHDPPERPRTCSFVAQPDQNGRHFQVLIYLSGLTCTNENFIIKAGAQRVAAELGLALVAPDTSPRGLGIEGEDDSYDFGTGAAVRWEHSCRMVPGLRTVHTAQSVRQASKV